MNKDAISCLHSWADELLSRASRVRNLIGDAHWLSDGHHKEEIVRHFLARHLPPSLRISRGFIRPSDDKSPVSPEIDVLITDREAELPWFDEGGLAIVPPSAVRGHLHVKTELGRTELRSVFESALRVYNTCATQRDCETLWSGAIFFASSNYDSPEKAAQVFTAALRAHLTDSKDKNRHIYLPNCVAILNGPIILIDKRRRTLFQSEAFDLRIFECGKLAIAILLSDLYDSIAERGRTLTKRGEWVQLLQTQEYRLISSETVKSG